MARDDAGRAVARAPRRRGRRRRRWVRRRVRAGHAGADRAHVPVGRPGRVPDADAGDPARGAAARDHRRPRRRAGPDLARRPPAHRLHGGDPRTAPRSSVGLATAARIAWEGGSRRMVALGTPAAWFAAASGGRRRPGGIRRVPGAASGLRLPAQPGHGRVGAPDGVGAGRGPAARLPVRPVGPGPNGRCGTGPRRGRSRGLYVGDASLFPTALGREPDDHDDGLGAARRADGARRRRPAADGPAAGSGGGRLRVPARRRARQGRRSTDAAAGWTRPARSRSATTAATITTRRTVRGVQRLLEDDRAEDHRDDGVHVGVGGHARERRDRAPARRTSCSPRGCRPRSRYRMPTQLSGETAAASNVASSPVSALATSRTSPPATISSAAREQRGRGQDGPPRRVDRAERPADRARRAARGGRPGRGRRPRRWPGEDRDADARRRRYPTTPARGSRSPKNARPKIASHIGIERDQQRGDARGDRLLGPGDEAHRRRAAARADDGGVERPRGGSAARSVRRLTSATRAASRIPAGTNRKKPITNGGIVSTATLMPRYVEPQTK